MIMEIGVKIVKIDWFAVKFKLKISLLMHNLFKIIIIKSFTKH